MADPGGDPRKRRQSGADIARALDDELAAGRPVVLWVDTNGDGVANHFVVAERKELSADGTVDYVILDPAYSGEFRYRLDEKGDLVATQAYHVRSRTRPDGQTEATNSAPVAHCLLPPPK